MKKDTVLIKEQGKPGVSTEQVWEEFSESLRRFVYSKVSNQDIADDIIKMFFIKSTLTLMISKIFPS